MTAPTPDGLIKVAGACCGLLDPVADRDWEVRAGDLDWSCRRTLEHLASLAFAPQLAMRAATFRPLALRVAADASVEQLLWTMQTMSHILADVARALRTAWRVGRDRPVLAIVASALEECRCPAAIAGTVW
jgi:hypothetical protein